MPVEFQFPIQFWCPACETDPELGVKKGQGILEKKNCAVQTNKEIALNIAEGTKGKKKFLLSEVFRWRLVSGFQPKKLTNFGHFSFCNCFAPKRWPFASKNKTRTIFVRSKTHRVFFWPVRVFLLKKTGNSKAPPPKKTSQICFQKEREEGNLRECVLHTSF